jgi:tetratricopeptide (TPR) repeat protein
MADFFIDKMIEYLDMYIGMQPYCYFNDPTTAEKIASFEKMARIRLPKSYKTFLQFTNGGMIVDDFWDQKIKKENELDAAKWNSNCFLSLEEMKTEWNTMKNRNFGVSQQDRIIYPFIPFLRTRINEHLIFVCNSDLKDESHVFEAYHDAPPDTWGVVAQNFSEFLYNYLKSNGEPNMMGDEYEGVAADFIGPDEIIPPENENSDMIIERTTSSLKYRPDDDWALMQRGMAYMDKGNLKAALRDFNKCLSLVNDDAFYYFNRGTLFEKAGKTRAALIDFDVAVKLKPDDCLYLNCRAEMLQKMHKYEDALSDVNRVLQIDDRDLLAYYNRESIYRNIGEIEKADQDLRKIEEIKEENG